MAKRTKKTAKKTVKRTIRKAPLKKRKRAPYRKGKGDKKFVYALKKVGNKKRLVYAGKMT